MTSGCQAQASSWATIGAQGRAAPRELTRASAEGFTAARADWLPTGVPLLRHTGKGRLGSCAAGSWTGSVWPFRRIQDIRVRPRGRVLM